MYPGQGSIADSYVAPDEPMYNLVEPSIVKYPYDPRQAAQILEGLGFTKRPDGFLYDAEGQKLEVSIQIPLQNDIHAKTAAPVADAWQQLGVAVEQDPIPIQRAQDREYPRPVPRLSISPSGSTAARISDIWRFHSSITPLPENRFVARGFESRYGIPRWTRPSRSTRRRSPCPNECGRAGPGSSPDAEPEPTAAVLRRGSDHDLQPPGQRDCPRRRCSPKRGTRTSGISAVENADLIFTRDLGRAAITSIPRC